MRYALILAAFSLIASPLVAQPLPENDLPFPPTMAPLYYSASCPDGPPDWGGCVTMSATVDPVRVEVARQELGISIECEPVLSVDVSIDHRCVDVCLDRLASGLSEERALVHGVPIAEYCCEVPSYSQLAEWCCADEAELQNGGIFGGSWRQMRCAPIDEPTLEYTVTGRGPQPRDSLRRLPP